MSQVNIDGLHLHPATGTLALLDASQAFPISAIMIDPLIRNRQAAEIGCPAGLIHDQENSIAILCL
jgi:hypothetical protein